jgi:signal transduction histidine kinase
MRTLTDDLLDIARLDTEKALALEPVPPGEIARETKAIMGGFAEEKSCTLDVIIERGLPTIEADGSRLLRALENLVRNALEHADSRVELQVLAIQNGIAFEVRDDGPGLPLEEGGEVNFTSLAGLRSRPDSAGLGLTVVRKVAEAHGGRLSARNQENKGGALFRLEVPHLT